MELETQTFKQNLQKSKAYAQITLDEDCIIKDQKPDLFKIIHTKGNVIIGDVKAGRQTVWVTGRLHFTVLYRTEDNRLDAFSDSVEFGEKLFMDGIEETDPVRVRARLEDLNISVINSRKVAVRALVGLDAVSEQTVEESVACAAPAGTQQRSEPFPVLELAETKHDVLRIHGDLTLPQSCPNIGRVVYDNVEVRGLESACEGDHIRIQGEACVSILYSSTEGKMEWYETSVPFSETLQAMQENAHDICWVVCRPAEYELEAAEDYDGELRAVSFTLSMDVDVKLWREETLELLTDVYALDAKLTPQTQPFCTWKLLVKNEAKLRLSEQMELSDGQERILQLSACEGSVDVDQVELVEGGLKAEGVLTVHLLYATMDDSFPIAHAQEQVPFTQVIDAPGVTPGMQGLSYEIEPSVDQLSVNLLDSGRFEVKAVISLMALVMQEQCAEKITELSSEPYDAVALARQPGITGYIVRPGESLWDIAKAYHTTEADVMETNGLKAAAVQPGAKLVIVKRVTDVVQ